MFSTILSWLILQILRLIQWSPLLSSRWETTQFLSLRSYNLIPFSFKFVISNLKNIASIQLTIAQHLSYIKSLVKNIIIASPHIDIKDILLNIINRLHCLYQAFKTTISAKLSPISLDDHYSLRCSKKISINNDQSRESHYVNPSRVEAHSMKKVEKDITCVKICSKQDNSTINCQYYYNTQH